MLIPTEPGLYTAFVVGPNEERPESPNAIIEVYGESPFLRARIHTLVSCNHPMLQTGSHIDGCAKHITVGPKIVLSPL